jgi:hypothetical protein
LPAAWSPVFGEIIHNLRSALDYYVWELYVLENKAEPNIVFQQPTTLEWLDAVRALGTMHNHVLDFGHRIERDFFQRPS